MTGTPLVERADAYVADVLAGRVDVCRFVKLACKRHERDVERSKRDDFEFEFDAERAEDALYFVECLPHVKDVWAARGELIHLEPWQCFVVASIFGWVRKDTKQRRFRRAYVEVPRKNAKSTIAAGVGLYCFMADGVHGSEVYSGATTERQAWEVFRPARLMAQRTPELLDHYGVEVGAKTLSIPATGCRMEPVIGKPGDGASPSCAIIDEYHEHDSDELADTMLTGMGARAMAGSPLALFITTAGDSLAGPCYALRDEATKVLSGALPGESLFGIVYTLDDDDDWTTEAALRKANPNFGVSVSPSYLLDEQRKAITDARKQGVFKTKHCNVWVTSRSSWMNVEAWNRCANPKLDWSDCVGLPCWAGLDMALKTDFSSVVFVFLDGERFKVKARHYLPERTAQDPAKQHYAAWSATGKIEVAGEVEVDFDYVEDDVAALIERAHPRELAYDPAYAAGITQALERRTGVVRVEVPMQTGTFAGAMAELDGAVAAKRVEHDGDPVLTWMVSNVVARTTRRGMYPEKEKPENKIDGAVALLIAAGRAKLAIDNGAVDSVYTAERGLLTI